MDAITNRGLMLLSGSPLVQRGLDTVNRAILPRAATMGRLLGRTGEAQVTGFVDDVPDPNRPQAPGYDASTGVPWDINNQRPMMVVEPEPEAPPLMIRPRLPRQMSPEAIALMYRRETGMEPPEMSPRDRFAMETGRDIAMQREAPPMPPRRPADLPGPVSGERAPMPPPRPAEFNQAREQAGSILGGLMRDPYAGMSSQQMFERLNQMGEGPGSAQLYMRAAARQAEEGRAEKDAAGKAMGGAVDKPGSYALGGGSPSGSGSGNPKDAALLKALEIIHHMVTRG